MLDQTFELGKLIYCENFNLTGTGKPHGINAARKLRQTRRDTKWADKGWKKVALGTVFRSSPFGGSSHAKGIVLEKVGVESKQPNSAIRKCIRVQLVKNGKKVTAFVPNDGCLNFIDENVSVQFFGGSFSHSNGRLIAQFFCFSAFSLLFSFQDEVLISGFGRKGKAKGDIPGVRFKVVKVASVSLVALFKGKKEKPRS